MRHRAFVWIVPVFVASLLSLSASAADAPPKPPDITVKLGKLPELQMLPRPPITETQAKHIKELIASLAAIDMPDFGFSSTLSGQAFAPLPDQAEAGMMLILTNHNIHPSNNLKDLVALGPDALPFLLDALDDATPTKLTIKHDSGFGAMWHSDELPVNPVNPAEKVRFEARANKPDAEEKIIRTYTVTVGDICFVAVGQIVGRSYQAVRYQPSGCVVVNSTTHNPKLCAEVRANWKSADPRRTLFDSMLADYATQRFSDGQFIDGRFEQLWRTGSEFHSGAALRLLFYFPKESAALIAARLDGLDLSKDDEKIPNDFMRRIAINGVSADDFIRAVSWCREPAMREALTRAFKRADDMESLLATVPGVDDEKLIRSRLEPLLAAIVSDGGDAVGFGFDLLVALGRRTPATARAAFEHYLWGAGPGRCRTVCRAIGELKPAWDTDLLTPLLTDAREIDGFSYIAEENRNDSRLPIRVCDEAASTLSGNHPELKFELTSTHANLDKQIAVIRAQLASKK